MIFEIIRVISTRLIRTAITLAAISSIKTNLISITAHTSFMWQTETQVELIHSTFSVLGLGVVLFLILRPRAEIIRVISTVVAFLNRKKAKVNRADS